MGYLKETDRRKPGLCLESSMTTSRVSTSHSKKYDLTHFARYSLVLVLSSGRIPGTFFPRDHFPGDCFFRDSVLTDYFMVLKLKMALKETNFPNVEEIKARVTAFVKTILKEEFLASFQQLYERFKTCVERRGMYVEN